MRIQHAVILAAGMGQRLAAVNPGTPKALFRVERRALIDYACAFAEAVGSEERIVVGGFGFEALGSHIAQSGRRNVRLIQAPTFRAGNIVSLHAAMPWVAGPVLLMNVDHIYSEPVRATVVSVEPRMAIFCDMGRALSADDMKVAVDGRGCLREISKGLTTCDAGYVGLTYVPLTDVDTFRRAVVSTLSREGEQASAERVLQFLADEGHAIQICDLSHLRWAEIDTPADYYALDRTIADSYWT